MSGVSGCPFEVEAASATGRPSTKGTRSATDEYFDGLEGADRISPTWELSLVDAERPVGM